MAGLKQIKNKIRSVNKTRKVTKAMEAVSAVKMRKAQERALMGRPYARAALTILKRASGSIEASGHPLVARRERKQNLGLVVITSDKGLAGSLNSAVIKEAHRVIAEKGYAREHVHICAIGRKGHDHFAARGFPLFAHYPALDDGAPDEAGRIARELIGGFLEEVFDECFVIYTNFHSTFEQEAVARRLLRVSFPAVEETIQGIVPEKGRYAELAAQAGDSPETYTIEPDAETVLNELIPHLVSIELHHALLEAAASEHSARMVAMKNASDKAGDMSRDLNLAYNKERQAVITREVSEIVSGIETMR